MFNIVPRGNTRLYLITNMDRLVCILLVVRCSYIYGDGGT